VSGSIDLLTALDLLGKAEARVAELEAALNAYIEATTFVGSIPGDTGSPARPSEAAWRAALAAVRQEMP
jgi:hypothetical protein